MVRQRFAAEWHGTDYRELFALGDRRRRVASACRTTCTRRPPSPPPRRASTSSARSPSRRPRADADRVIARVPRRGRPARHLLPEPLQRRLAGTPPRWSTVGRFGRLLSAGITLPEPQAARLLHRRLARGSGPPKAAAPDHPGDPHDGPDALAPGPGPHACSASLAEPARPPHRGRGHGGGRHRVRQRRPRRRGGDDGEPHLLVATPRSGRHARAKPSSSTTASPNGTSPTASRTVPTFWPSTSWRGVPDERARYGRATSASSTSSSTASLDGQPFPLDGHEGRKILRPPLGHLRVGAEPDARRRPARRPHEGNRRPMGDLYLAVASLDIFPETGSIGPEQATQVTGRHLSDMARHVPGRARPPRP